MEKLRRRKDRGKEDASDLLVQLLQTLRPLPHGVSQQVYVVLARCRRQLSVALTASEFVTRHLRMVGNPRPDGSDLVEFFPQVSNPAEDSRFSLPSSKQMGESTNFPFQKGSRLSEGNERGTPPPFRARSKIPSPSPQPGRWHRILKRTGSPRHPLERRFETISVPREFSEFATGVPRLDLPTHRTIRKRNWLDVRSLFTMVMSHAGGMRSTWISLDCFASEPFLNCHERKVQTVPDCARY